MKKILIAGLLFCSTLLSAQVVVDGKDLNTTVNMFEVHIMAKPFNNKPSMGADTGTNDFKPSYYDLKRQAIYDKDGKKFEKGEYMRLQNYLAQEGWEQGATRDIKLGDQTGQAIIFKRKKA